MTSEGNLVAAETQPDDAEDVSLRPQTLDEFIGQHHLSDNLRVFVEAARGRGEYMRLSWAATAAL